jgi:pseudaminic acid synthase
MQIKIGNKILGKGNPTFIVAEMSGNHGGSLDRAKEIIYAAKRAGADAIKLQTFTADTITIKSNKQDFKILDGTMWDGHENLWSLYNEAHTPWEWHQELFLLARSLDLEIFSSPFDDTAVDFLEKLNVNVYKIASPEITNIPLLEKVAKTMKPVIISTGVATILDIELALKTLKEAGSKEIIVLKCTTSYPAPAEDSNLKTIEDICDRFNVLSGLSDHTIGIGAAIASIVYGASVIEKHFITDESPTTVDSFFSAGEKLFTQMVQEVRFVEKAMGNVCYEIVDSAKPSLRGRSSLYISEFIKKGEKFTNQNIKAVRPSFGLHPKYFNEIIGKIANKDLEPGDRVSFDIIYDSK